MENKRLDEFIAKQSFASKDSFSNLTEEGVEYLNSLCSWISYDEDDSDEEEEEEEEGVEQDASA